MSGANPQGLNVAIGPFPGCQESPNGSPGQTSYYVPPTGVDANGCPVGGSIPSVDDFNGIFQALNCILTKGDTEPLPTECLCADPCMLYDKLVEIINELALAAICNIGDATQNQKDAIEANPELAQVVVCYNGTAPIKVPSDCLGSGTVDPPDPTACSATNTGAGEVTIANGPAIMSCNFAQNGNGSTGITWYEVSNGIVRLGQFGGSGASTSTWTPLSPNAQPAGSTFILGPNNYQWQTAMGEQNFDVTYNFYCPA